jgi:hypothetical protein
MASCSKDIVKYAILWSSLIPSSEFGFGCTSNCSDAISKLVLKHQSTNFVSQ